MPHAVGRQHCRGNWIKTAMRSIELDTGECEESGGVTFQWRTVSALVFSSARRVQAGALVRSRFTSREDTKICSTWLVSTHDVRSNHQHVLRSVPGYSTVSTDGVFQFPLGPLDSRYRRLSLVVRCMAVLIGSVGCKAKRRASSK